MKKTQPRRIIRNYRKVLEFETPDGKFQTVVLGKIYYRPWAWFGHTPKIPTKLAALLNADEVHLSHILAMKDTLEQLFNDGWGYQDYASTPELVDLLDMSGYRIPMHLAEVMLGIQGDVRESVLILRRVPTAMWMLIPRLGPPTKAPDSDEEISDAPMDDVPIPISPGVMYDTEEIADVKERAGIIFDQWYPRMVKKIRKETDDTCNILDSERSGISINEVAETMKEFSSAEQLLIDMEIKPIDRAIWFAVQEEWKWTEVAEGAKRLGRIGATPDSVKGDFQKIEDKLLRTSKYREFAIKISGGIDKTPQ